VRQRSTQPVRALAFATAGVLDTKYDYGTKQYIVKYTDVCLTIYKNNPLESLKEGFLSVIRALLHVLQDTLRHHPHPVSSLRHLFANLQDIPLRARW